jgi:hypothetical protein
MPTLHGGAFSIPSFLLFHFPPEGKNCAGPPAPRHGRSGCGFDNHQHAFNGFLAGTRQKSSSGNPNVLEARTGHKLAVPLLTRALQLRFHIGSKRGTELSTQLLLTAGRFFDR